MRKIRFTIFNVKVTARELKKPTIFTFSSKLLIRLQPNLVCYKTAIKSESSWKNGTTVFKVKVTAKVQNVSECLSG